MLRQLVTPCAKVMLHENNFNHDLIPAHALLANHSPILIVLYTVSRHSPAAFCAGVRRWARMRCDTFRAASRKLGSAMTRSVAASSESVVMVPGGTMRPKPPVHRLHDIVWLIPRTLAGRPLGCHGMRPVHHMYFLVHFLLRCHAPLS